MLITTYENQNQLRLAVREAWNKPFSMEHAIILHAADQDEINHAFRMFASELGARFITLPLEKELTQQQVELLERKGPRIVLMTGLETLPPSELQALPQAINRGGRALPVIFWHREASEVANDDDEPLEAAV